MPIVSLSKRNSGGSSKEKKSSNRTSSASIASSSSAVDSSLNSSHCQASSKNSKGEANEETMKSTSRKGSSKSKAEPDTASQGSGDHGGKEAKEKSQRSSWVKTIGIRTLRLRKEQKSKQTAQGVFSTTGRTGAEAECPPEIGIEALGAPSNSNGSHAGTGSVKHVKKSSSGASKTSNGNVLRENSTFSFSSNTSPGVDTSGKSKASPRSAPQDEISDKQDPARFAGDGMSFKAKLIGILEVSGPRGDRICQEALSELKMAVKAAGEHKQKITLHVALDGLRIRDEKTGDCLYHHQVHKISFIAQDLTDARAFGYIFGSPDMGHRFFGIKTEKSASQVVIAMRDLFQVVFDLKKKEIERAKQQLEMQQKFLATRAAEAQPKVEHKSSIAETYIEGACALGNGTEITTSGQCPPEVDLLNLEVELNSLQEGLDNIHNNFADHAPFRGSTASISSDPMNPKFSTSSVGGGSGTGVTPGFGGFGGDPFGDSFDPFDTTSGCSLGQSQSHSTNTTSMNANHQSPISFGGVDPFAQVDPFPQPRFNNLEGTDPYFNSDPFETPVRNFSFTFANEGNTSGLSAQDSANTSAGSDRYASASKANHVGSNSRLLSHRSNSAMAETTSFEPASSWKASFDDNFVPDAKALVSVNGPNKPSADIFTELDPLGTGRVRPFVDRKDFFQDLKHPPRKVLKDLHGTESCDELGVTGGNSFVGTPPNSSSPKESTKVQESETKISIPNSFSTNFNPVGFDSAFKSALHASSMSKARKYQQQESNTRPNISNVLRDSFRLRSDSPPGYSPPPPPTCSNSGNTAFSNNEYFATPATATMVTSSHSSIVKSTPPPLLPPPGSTGSPGTIRSKKSPQLLKQMTISSGVTSSSSPKTLPRSARLGKHTTVDFPSSDEMSPIPNLTPPPRPPHGTLHKNVTLSTAVPRPYSSDKTQVKITGVSSFSSRSFISTSLAPEPPPRPLQTTTTNTSSGTSNSISVGQSSPQLPIVSPPPLPPKKSSIGPTLSSMQISSSTQHKNLYTTDLKRISDNKLENDLPLPLPSRKMQSGISSSNVASNANRYSIPEGAAIRESRYEFPKHDVSETSEPPSVSMEQAIQQVASLSLGQLASKLEMPVEKLSSYTIQQLAEKLTLTGLDQPKKGSHRDSSSRVDRPRKTNTFGSTSNLGFETNFTPIFDDDISTMSAPGGFVTKSAPTSGPVSGSSDNYDKYAVFRELTVEDASGFSLGNENDLSEDDERSRTQDRTLTGRDSSSERTLHVEDVGFSLNEPNTNTASICGLNTMDDVTDANLSDENDKFPLDEEVSKSEWATFETNFDDFASANVPSHATHNPIQLQPIKKRDSPWDSDDQEKDDALTTPTKVPEPFMADDKLLHCVLPPDPEEFNFQPFEKPAPIITGQVMPGRRSSRDRNLQYESFELEPRLPGPSQFKRQSSGSSKHSLGRNSDVSDSGRHRSGGEPNRSRNNSRDLDSWEGGRGREREYEDWDRDTRRERDVWEKEAGIRRGEREFGRSDSRGSYSRQGDGRKFSRDSDEEFGVPSRFSGNSRDSSLRRSDGRGSRSRGSSARISKRGSQRSRDNLDRDEEEEDVEDDDRSYASYHSGYSQSSHHRRHRRHPPKHHPPSQSVGYGRRLKRNDISPERYSNHESDCDDSYEEDNSRRKDYYARDYYSKHPSFVKDRPNSSSSRGKRYDRNYDHDSPRDYYRSSREREDRGRYHRRSHGRPEGVDGHDDGREYSDYSCEEASTQSRKYGKGKSRGGRDRDRSQYYTNSPSWDSESQSPDRGDGNSNSGGDRRKLRWGSGYRDRSRQSPSPLTLSRQERASHAGSGGSSKPKKSDSFRFEDDFSPKRAEAGAFESFQEEEQRKDLPDISATAPTSLNSDRGSTSLPPQSPFEDNFVVQVASNTGQLRDSDQLDSIEFKRGEDDVDSFGLGAAPAGDVFFPAKFDVELEVGKESKKPTDGSSSSVVSITPIPTPTSADLTRSSPSGLVGGGKRLESIRSEEERLESSEDGAEIGGSKADDIEKEEDKDEEDKEEEEKKEIILETDIIKDPVFSQSSWMSFDSD